MSGEDTLPIPLTTPEVISLNDAEGNAAPVSDNDKYEPTCTSSSNSVIHTAYRLIAALRSGFSDLLQKQDE
jgi:hypothetical protein